MRRRCLPVTALNGSTVRLVDAWFEPAVWARVADELRELRSQRLGRLLTKPTLRLATAKSLVGAGVDPDQMRYRWPHPSITGSRIDLVVGIPPSAVIELSYPRDPNDRNAGWMRIYGEILRNLYRLATYPRPADRIFVYAESAQLHKRMTDAAAERGFDTALDTIVLRPTALLVTAHRLAVVPVDPTLNLAVFAVDPTSPAVDTSRDPALLGAGACGLRAVTS